MKYEVIVIGAGPAGLSFGRNYGAGCLILDAKPVVNQNKVCGEALTTRGISELDLSQGELSSIVVYETQSIRIFPPVYSETQSEPRTCFVAPERTYMINRDLMAKALAAKATENGAAILTNHRVTSARKDSAGVVVATQAKRFVCDMVVFADGAGTMSRQFGFESPKERVVCFQYLLSNVQLEDSESVEVFGLNRKDPSGYIWIFPRGKNLFHVGIGFTTKLGTRKTPKECLNDFIHDGNGCDGPLRFKRAKVAGAGGGVVLLGGFNRESYSDRSLVIGEAAGCVNSLSGGGIRTALSSGRIAASVATDAIKRNDVSAETLSSYPRKYYEEEGVLEGLCLKLRSIYKTEEADQFDVANRACLSHRDENKGLSFDEILKIYYRRKKSLNVNTR